ncbi:MAG: hypothetical protein JNL62_11910 [Bryobacterales bacterium]|nr:hypothetical protein [Bryobacterales bacterium]
MPNVPSKHADYNKFAIIGDDETLSKITFWDIGTGNCDSLHNATKPYLFYDFGGNFKAGGGSKTYPKTTPTFGFDASSVFIISHWDCDHFFSLKKATDAGDSKWIGTRENISKDGKTQLNKHCKQLFCFPKTDTAKHVFTSTGGLELQIIRCTGPSKKPTGTNKEIEDKIRNDSGLALFLYVKTDAAKAVRAMQKSMQAKIDALALPDKTEMMTAAGVLGTDIYKNLVIRAVQPLVATGTVTAGDMVNAGIKALDAEDVRQMARVAAAALEQAKAAPGNAVLVATKAKQADPISTSNYVTDVYKAAETAALLDGTNGAAAATAAKNALTKGGLANPAAVAAIAMLEKALAGGSVQETLAAAVHGNNPYILQILGAAKRKSKETGPPTALEVAKAAIDALSPATPNKVAVLFTGDAAYQSVPGAAKHCWDVLLAYHHGTAVEFTGTGDPAPPLPVLEGHSKIFYCSGRKGATKVYGHPDADAVKKYKDHGWTVDYYTTHGYGNSQHDGSRGTRTYTLP